MTTTAAQSAHERPPAAAVSGERGTSLACAQDARCTDWPRRLRALSPPWLARCTDDEPPGLEEVSDDEEPPALEPGPRAPSPPPAAAAAAARPTSAGSKKEPELSGITPEMAKRMVQGGAASGKSPKPTAGLGGSSRERLSPQRPGALPAAPANGHGADTEGMPPLEEESSDEGPYLGVSRG